MNPSISTNRVRDAVKTVNNIAPDINGDVVIAAVATVNAVAPDISGNVNLNPADVGWVGQISGNASLVITPTIVPVYGNSIDLAVQIDPNVSNGLSLTPNGLLSVPRINGALNNAISLTPTGLYAPKSNTLLSYKQTIVATAGVEYQIPHSFSTPHVFVQAYDWGSIIEWVLVQPSNVRIDISNVWVTFSTSSTFIVNILWFSA